MNDNEKITRKQAEAEAKRVYKALKPEGWTLAEWITDHVAALEADGYIKD